MRFFRSFFVVMIVLPLLLAIKCFEDEKEKSRVLKIGLIIPKSGDLKNVGQSVLNAAQMWLTAVNSKGGIRINNENYLIEFLVKDNKDSVDLSIKAVQSLQLSGVKAIIGPILSRNAVPSAKVAEALKIPLIAPWSTNPETTKDKKFVIRVAGTDDVQGEALAQFARMELKVEKVAILYDRESNYNQYLAEVFKKEFEQAGGYIVAFETYRTGHTDFSRQINAIKQAKPQVILLPNYAHEIDLQISQIRSQISDAVFLGSDTWYSLPADVRSRVEGSYFFSQWSPDISGKNTQHFLREFRRLYGKQPDDVAALTFDGLGLLKQAMMKASSLDGEKVSFALRNATYDGVVGTKIYRNSGDPQGSTIMLQIKQGENIFYKLFQGH